MPVIAARRPGVRKNGKKPAFTDPFTGADASSIATGAPIAWQFADTSSDVAGQAWTRTSNQAVSPARNTHAHFDPGTANVDITVTLASFPAGSSPGLLARFTPGIVSGGAPSNAIILCPNLNDPNLQLSWYDAAHTQTIFWTDTGHTVVSGDVIRWALLGSTYTVYLNGAQRTTGSLPGGSGTLTGRNAGMSSLGGASGRTYDNFILQPL